jgi:hypothetical protein
MCNQLVSITIDANLILNIRFQVSRLILKIRHYMLGCQWETNVIGTSVYVLFKIHFHLSFQNTIIFLGPIKY